MISLPQRGVR